MFLLVHRVVFGFLGAPSFLQVAFAVFLGVLVLFDKGLTFETPPRKVMM